jgi:hypothetical protein
MSNQYTHEEALQQLIKIYHACGNIIQYSTFMESKEEPSRIFLDMPRNTWERFKEAFGDLCEGKV